MACADCDNGFRDRDGERRPCRPCIRRVRWVQEYAETLASWMGLTDWTIQVIVDSTSSDTSMAEIDCIYGQRLAKIAVSDDWDNYTPTMQRDTLVHELVHATLAPLTQMADDMLDAIGEGVAATTAKAAMSNAEEWVTDAIALAWAQHLPLPKGQK